LFIFFFFFNDTATTEIYTLSLHDALPIYPIPIILLARLAVDRDEKGTGLGKALLKDALLRIAHAADIVGARAVLVHDIDEQARKFYQHFGFEASPLHELQLMLLIKDLRKSIEE